MAPPIVADMMITVINNFKAAALSVNPSGTNRHGRRDDRTLASISQVMPLIWMLPPRMSDPLPGEILFTTQMIIGFYMQDTPETSEAQREVIIDTMNILATQFIGALRLINKQYDVQRVTREPQYRMFSGTLSGVAISLNYLTTQPC